MDCKNKINKMNREKENQNEAVRKNTNNPRKIMRDWLRAKMYRSRKLRQEIAKEEDPREPTHIPSEEVGRKDAKRKVWKRISKLTQIGQSKKQKQAACSPRTSTDNPTETITGEFMYVNIENGMRLSRLEEKIC